MTDQLSAYELVEVTGPAAGLETISDYSTAFLADALVYETCRNITEHASDYAGLPVKIEPIDHHGQPTPPKLAAAMYLAQRILTAAIGWLETSSALPSHPQHGRHVTAEDLAATFDRLYSDDEDNATPITEVHDLTFGPNVYDDYCDLIDHLIDPDAIDTQQLIRAANDASKSYAVTTVRYHDASVALESHLAGDQLDSNARERVTTMTRLAVAAWAGRSGNPLVDQRAIPRAAAAIALAGYTPSPAPFPGHSALVELVTDRYSPAAS